MFVSLTCVAHVCHSSGCEIVQNTMLGNIQGKENKEGLENSTHYMENIKEWLTTTLRDAAQLMQDS